ncbi:hypothetical protein HYV81_04925 [Candidatus Woesearchaeota archaeon]|nr:hypothetical protein [Candidatus Woesearchaeota archaeon]
MLRKHIATIFTCILLLFSILALAHEEDDDNVLEAKKTALELAAQKHLIKLEATLSVAEKQNLNTVDLLITKENFKEAIDGINAANTKEELKAAQDQLVDIAQDFRKQAKASAVDVYKSEVSAEMGLQLEKSRNATQQYVDKAAEARRTAILRLFDHHVEDAQEAVDKLKLKDVNTADVEARLAQFKALKPELVASLASGDKSQVSETMRKVQLNWQQLKKSFREATRGKQMTEALERADKLAERVQRNIDKLREKGVPTTVLETKLATFKTKVTDARNALQLANYDAAEVILKQIKSAYVDLKQSHQDIVGKATGKAAVEKKFTEEDIKKGMEKKPDKAMKGESS